MNDDLRLRPDPPEPAPETPAAPAAPASPLNRRTLWIMIGVGAGLVLTGVWLVFAALPSFLTTPETTSAAPPPAAASAEEARKIQATLFFVTDDGLELMSVSREVRYGATPAEQARFIVEAQIAPAADKLTSAIPPGVTVKNVFIGARGEAYVDLSAEVSRNHPGGSQNESLTVYALVNAVTANLPTVTGVQILIDGQEVDTLAGHVDLRQPFGRTLRWVRKAQSQP